MESILSAIAHHIDKLSDDLFILLIVIVLAIMSVPVYFLLSNRIIKMPSVITKTEEDSDKDNATPTIITQDIDNPNINKLYTELSKILNKIELLQQKIDSMENYIFRNTDKIGNINDYQRDKFPDIASKLIELKSEVKQISLMLVHIKSSLGELNDNVKNIKNIIDDSNKQNMSF